MYFPKRVLIRCKDVLSNYRAFRTKEQSFEGPLWCLVWQDWCIGFMMRNELKKAAQLHASLQNITFDLYDNDSYAVLRGTCSNVKVTYTYTQRFSLLS